MIQFTDNRLIQNQPHQSTPDAHTSPLLQLDNRV